MRNCIRPDARSIPMVVPYAGGILSGQGMLVGAFFGVAASDAAQNASVECETRGEFDRAAASYQKAYQLNPKGIYRDAIENLNRRIADAESLQQRL